MERILNDYEKIKKAEEIYYRRNHKNVAIANRKMETKATKTYLGSKILLEMLILLILAVIVFAVKNKDYIFSPSFLERVAQYNVNLSQKLDFIMAYLKEDGETKTEEVFVNHAQTENTESNANLETTEPIQTEQIDAPTVENPISFIKPINGVVTSGFGARESMYQNVTGQHTGIDIGADSGTMIQASMAGIVTQVSTEGDYGNHIKITQGNISTLYAHCQDIYVTEGQEIVQGQGIASVGSTGNSTGPHLHFEIRVDDVPINPADKVSF